MSPAEDPLAELRARVSRLEAQLAPEAAGDRGARAPHPDETFWLLEQLPERGLDGAVVFAGRLRDRAGDPVSWQIAREATALLDTDWSHAAPALAALGHPSRMQILQLVARGEARTAAELARAEGLGTTGQIYHHLRQLVAAGWLQVTTRGRYQVPGERLVPLLVVLAAARP